MGKPLDQATVDTSRPHSWNEIEADERWYRAVTVDPVPAGGLAEDSDITAIAPLAPDLVPSPGDAEEEDFDAAERRARLMALAPGWPVRPRPIAPGFLLAMAAMSVVAVLALVGVTLAV